VCGICGVVRSDEGVPDGLVKGMTEALRHRGPDDEGLWNSGDGRVALGHRRLAVIDLSPLGHQPMADATARLWVVLNGEIYNFRELRADLACRGHRFRTRSDTEVLLAAYRQWGIDAVRRLNGMFAFALYDTDRAQLFLARDRAGEKPLFYRHHDGRFSFASELKALMTDPTLPRVIDRSALDQYLTFGYVGADACILRGVRKLPQGCALTYDLRRDTVRVWTYWSLPEPWTPDQPPRVDDELVDELDELLLESVRMRLVADVPVGTMLSGGLDSSLVTAMAARVSSRRVRTFTIAFPGHGRFDEAPFARSVARHFGTEHVELAAGPATVDLMPELARQYDEPLADSSMVPTYLVSRLIRREATVALGGDGGDELFGGNQHYEWIRRHALCRRLVPGPLREVTSRLGRALPIGFRGRHYLITSNRDADWAIASANAYFDTETRGRLLGTMRMPADAGPERDKMRLALGHSPVQRAMAADFRSYLVDDILAKVDRASMLASLEVRAPFLDPRIIDFAYGKTPDHLRAWKGKRKVILRKLGRRLLPASFDIDRKQGFSLPLHAWFEGDWGRFLCDVVRRSDVFDRRVVEQLIRSQERGRHNAHRLFALAMFELWRRTYKVTW
jgi:asparagine synthase (glutamine-hydrolysing)